MTMRLVLIGGVFLASLGLGRLDGSDPFNFDRLNDADREVFQERFKKELWPLLVKGGKDGCVGCHDKKVQSSLRFVGDPDRDFRLLLKDGFFLHDDPGNLLARLVTRDRKSRMPPGQRPPWPKEDIEVMRRFIIELDARQKK